MLDTADITDSNLPLFAGGRPFGYTAINCLSQRLSLEVTRCSEVRVGGNTATEHAMTARGEWMYEGHQVLILAQDG